MSEAPERSRRVIRSLVVVQRWDGTLLVSVDSGDGVLQRSYEEFRDPETVSRYVRSIVQQWQESRS